MTYRFLLVFSLFLTTVLSVAAEKPNIVFIFTDDQSFNTIAALGHPIIKTPNLDKLVREGTSFTNAYIQGAWRGAVCISSRSMLNTGRFLWNAKNRIEDFRPENKGGLSWTERNDAEAEFWSRLLKASGYTTYFTGKWHVSVPLEKMFDYIGEIPPADGPTNSSYNRPIEGVKDIWSPYDTKLKSHWIDGRHRAEIVADKSIELLESATQREEPFFLYLAFHSPHDSRQSPKEYVDMYPQEKTDVPANFLPENPYKDVMGCPVTLRDERLAPFPRTEYAVRVHRSEYYAIISHLDTQIGRVLDALEKSGKKENTYIFFASDNGLAIGSHGLFGKQSMFEHSAKIPLIVAGPNVPHNKRIETPVYLQDIVPTSLDIAGTGIPKHVQFKSLLPLFQDETVHHYDAIYGAYIQQQRMVRKDHFKLIIYPEGNIRLLYDLKNDPDEKNNLAEKPEYAAKIEELFKELQRLQEETGDTLNLESLLKPQPF